VYVSASAQPDIAQIGSRVVWLSSGAEILKILDPSCVPRPEGGRSEKDDTDADFAMAETFELI
jgi:hypothetical protein